jgi:hypothetical protein
VEANRGQFFTANRFPVVKVMSRAALRESVFNPAQGLKVSARNEEKSNTSKTSRHDLEMGVFNGIIIEVVGISHGYQDAIDAIESIPDRRDFAEKFTMELSFLELKMGAPAKAVKRCRAFLEERSFSAYLAGEIINYEYGKKWMGVKLPKTAYPQSLPLQTMK